jgi:hypothetical protein
MSSASLKTLELSCRLLANNFPHPRLTFISARNFMAGTGIVDLLPE